MEAKYGERIREVRKAKGLTQAELARRAGVGVNTIARYEANERFATVEMLRRIAEALEVDWGEFLWADSKDFYMSVEQSMQMLVDELPKTKLLAEFDKLNKAGKNEAVKRTAELAKLPEYIKPDEE